MPTKPPAPAPKPETEPARKPRAPRLTQQQVVAIFNAQGGRCWVLGTDLAGDEWSVVDGRAVSAEARRLKGARTWDELRTHILDKVESAAADVQVAAADLANAKAAHQQAVKDFGALLMNDPDGKAVAVVFAGETIEAVKAGPSPLAVEPAGGAQQRKAVVES